MMGGKKGKKSVKKKKASPPPKPEPVPTPAPAVEVVEPLIAPIMPLPTTSNIIPSYSMVAAPAYAPTSYAAPATNTYAAPQTYASPVSYASPATYATGYPGAVV